MYMYTMRVFLDLACFFLPSFSLKDVYVHVGRHNIFYRRCGYDVCACTVCLHVGGVRRLCRSVESHSGQLRHILSINLVG